MEQMQQKCTLCDMNVLLLNDACGNACVSKRCSHSKVNPDMASNSLVLDVSLYSFFYCREDGNAAYQEGKHELAILLYTEAMRSVITLSFFSYMQYNPTCMGTRTEIPSNVLIQAVPTRVNVQVASPASPILQ
jgi:hypothetical protein